MKVIFQFAILFSMSLAAFAQSQPVDSTEAILYPVPVNLKMIQIGTCKAKAPSSQMKILIMGDMKLMAMHFEQGKLNPKVKASIIVLNGNSVEGSYSDLSLKIESKSENKYQLSGTIQDTNPMIGIETNKINLQLSSNPSYASFGGFTVYTCKLGSEN